MRFTFALRLSLAGLIGMAAYGQTPENAVQPDRLVQRAVDGTVRAALDPTRPKITFGPRIVTNPVLPPSSGCAIPLQEMTIPEGVNFTMKKTPGPLESHDQMPVGSALPACPQRQP
ncbi:MAG TPA: hypothetical protein VMH05_26325 [Bryobacteraceae bacterium]|nr:hypothetical protein [Bryobacteraceae bacterium]